MIKVSLPVVMACALVGAAAQEKGAPESIEVAFVANAEGASVAMVDVAARKVIGTISVNPANVKGEGPGAPNYAQDTDVSPDGRTLYVSRGYLGDVAAFEIASGRLIWTRPLNTMRADHMTLTRDGRELFVSAFVDNRVYRITTATGEITGHVASGIFPHDVKVSSDGRRLFNTSLGQMPSFPLPAGARPPLEKPEVPVQLTIADASTLAIRDRIPLDVAMRPWQFNANETGLYAELSNQHAVVFYDLAARKVTRRLDLPIKAGITVKDWDFEAPFHGLALTDDGATLCLAGRASDYAALVRAADLTLIATVPVGDAPGWAETADNGRVCLIANTRSDDLSLVSIADRKEVLRLPIGNGPKHITVARLPASVVAAIKPSAASDIAPATVVRVPSASLGREQIATILLPASYGTSRQRYPVLYLLHGGGQDHTAFATRGWFRALASRDMIVVTPSAGDSWYVNSVADASAKYEDFVVRDLIEFVDREYRTIASREGRAIAGVSMGAWGAMMLGLKHHLLFGAVGSMSAPFGISRQDPNMDMTSRTQQRFGAPETPERRERDPGTLASTIAVESVPFLYLACGNQDIFVADNRRFVERLTARKIPYEYRELSPFGHSWDVWDGQLAGFVDVISTRWEKIK